MRVLNKILKPTFKNIPAAIALFLLAVFSWLMLKIVLQYASMNSEAGFLQLKQSYITVDLWRLSFYTHVFSSMFVLVAGFSQFSSKLLTTKPLLHRRLGYAYVINILFVTGPAGVVMSFYANGGVYTRIAFISLSVLWIFFTSVAVYKAFKKDFSAHRAFMIRSYALTLSALSLRIWKVFFAECSNLGPMDRYRIIAWLGWVLNLLIAECILMRQINKRRSALMLQ